MPDKKVSPGKDDITLAAGVRFVPTVVVRMACQGVLSGICPATEMA